MELEEDTGPEPIVPGVARALSPLARRILALNPGARTGIGTNTYMIGIDEIVVIDPGPDDARHLDSVAGCGGDRIRWITWTQTGPDYTGGLEAMVARTGAKVLDPEAGTIILGTEFRVSVHMMPGPTADHHCFMLEEERMLLCGGLIADDRLAPLFPGQANLADLMESLERASKMRLKRIAPAHGYIIEAPKVALPAEIERRASVSESIFDAMRDGRADAADIVAAHHPEIDDPEIIDVLIATVEVHMEHLAAVKQAS